MIDPGTEVLQRNNYYAFGMELEGEWDRTTTIKNRYLYNGKEFHDWDGLNWQDYGARWYMPEVGRWNSVDPLARDYPGYSPYNYCLGNPIRLTDPTGMSPEDVDGIGINSSGKVVYDDGKKDGQLYYFGDYDGPKLTSMGQVANTGVSYQTAVGADGQIGSQEGFDGFMKAAITGLKGSNAGGYLSEIGSYEMNEKFGTNMSIDVGTRSGNKGGPYTYNIYPEGEMTFKLGKNPDVRNDYNLLRSTLTHELRHIDQAKGIRSQGPLSFETLSDYNKFSRGQEFDAYNHQINHRTFDLLNSSQRSKIINKRNLFSN